MWDGGLLPLFEPSSGVTANALLLRAAEHVADATAWPGFARFDFDKEDLAVIGHDEVDFTAVEMDVGIEVMVAGTVKVAPRQIFAFFAEVADPKGVRHEVAADHFQEEEDHRGSGSAAAKAFWASW